MSNEIMIKMINGEELIAQRKTETDSTIVVSLPVSVQPQMDPNGQVGIAMAPWVPFAKDDKNVEINKDLVLTVYTPVEEMINQYNTRFGSGLVLAANMPKELLTE